MKTIHNMLKFIIVAIIAINIYYTACGQSVNTPKNQTVYTQSNWDTAPLIAVWEDLAADWIIDHSSGAQRLAPATSNYNCHAYAWHVSDGGSASNCWMNFYYSGGANVSKYWTNDAFSSATAVDEYCKLFYGTTADHSAIRTATPGVVKSKWGWWGLYEHAVADCPFQDNPVYTYYSSPISGDNIICSTSKTYSATSISGASTYTWTGDKISISGSGYSVTGSKTGSGTGWIHAEIYSPYSGTTFGSEKKLVWAGIPILNYITGPESGEINNIYNYDAYPPYDIHSGASYYWNLQPMNSNYLYSSYDHAEIHFYDADAYQVIAQATNSCGSTDNAVLDIYITEQRYFELSPNPASEEFTIVVKENKVKTKDPIFAISIYNMFGILERKYTRSGKSFTIPIYNLQDGNYIVRIDDGEKIVAKKLIVKH